MERVDISFRGIYNFLIAICISKASEIFFQFIHYFHSIAPKITCGTWFFTYWK